MTNGLYFRIFVVSFFFAAAAALVPGSIFLRLPAALLAAGFITFFVGRIVDARFAGPLRQIAAALRKIASGNWDQRVAVEGDRDVAAAQRTLNAMSQAVSASLKEIKEEKQKVESIVNAMGEGVMVLDRSGRITLTNRALIAMLGRERDLIGHTPLEVFRNPALENGVRNTLAGGPPRIVELAFNNGRALAAHVSGVPNLSGVVDAAVVVCHDLTEHRRIEQMRRDFVANVSHEFKTPLTAIRGYTETLLGGALEDSKTAADFLRIVERNARHLESLVSDLLTLARMEAELPAQLETVNVRSLIDEQISSKQGAIVQRQLSVVTQCPPIELHVDRARLIAAISNLIDNAVYYNRPSGEIQIAGVQENGSFVLSIADTGEGIPPADIHRIFERFYRVDKARARDSGGTGLGLAIVRHAIESQGGTITVTSKLGSGSRFSIHLPIRPPAR